MGIKTHATVCVGKFTVQLKIGEPLIDKTNMHLTMILLLRFGAISIASIRISLVIIKVV